MKIVAQAKINLTLRITGQRDDGYHLLQSLVAFTDFGDDIEIERSDQMRFDIAGPFADAFDKADREISKHSGNLMIKAFHVVAEHFDIVQTYHIKLTKNLPLASGIGGGTSDAASMVKLILNDHHQDMSDALMVQLTRVIGADFPVCFYAGPCVMEGIGEKITLLGAFPKMPIMLINPGISCPSKDVFMNRKGLFYEPSEFQESYNQDTLLSMLKENENDLYHSAAALYPVIKTVKECLESDAEYVGMSGSGATCFGLFKNNENAQKRAKEIRQKYPHWWVETGFLNGI